MRYRQYLVGFALIIFALATSLVASAKDLPRAFPEPPSSQISVVSDNSKTLGMNLNIRKFSSTKSLEDVVKYYQTAWGDQAATTIYSPWTMVGTRVAGQFFNVQVQRQGLDSWGYLSISDLPEKVEQQELGQFAPLKHSDIAAMGNTQVLDTQKHGDLLNFSTTNLMSNRFSIESNRNFYLQHYQGKGWTLKQDSENSLLQSRVLLFAKGSKSLSFTINQIAGETQIVANLIAAKQLGD